MIKIVSIEAKAVSQQMQVNSCIHRTADNHVCFAICHVLFRSQQSEPQHPVHNYKAWTRNSSGFLSLAQPTAATDSEELITPTVYLQVRTCI